MKAIFYFIFRSLYKAASLLGEEFPINEVVADAMYGKGYSDFFKSISPKDEVEIPLKWVGTPAAMRYRFTIARYKSIGR
jgi:hypothetical protein